MVYANHYRNHTPRGERAGTHGSLRLRLNTLGLKGPAHMKLGSVAGLTGIS